MSEYKIEFLCDSNVNAFSLNRKVVDLVEDYYEIGVRICLES